MWQHILVGYRPKIRRTVILSLLFSGSCIAFTGRYKRSDGSLVRIDHICGVNEDEEGKKFVHCAVSERQFPGIIGCCNLTLFQASSCTVSKSKKTALPDFCSDGIDIYLLRLAEAAACVLEDKDGEDSTIECLKSLPQDFGEQKKRSVPFMRM